MAAKTKVQLVGDVLLKLGILDAVSTASAEDSAFVETRYDDKLAELRDKGLCYWPNTGRTTQEIPQAIYLALVDIMCEDVAPAFGVTTKPEVDDYNRPVTVGTKGMRNLRRHMAKQPSGEPTRATYF